MNSGKCSANDLLLYHYGELEGEEAARVAAHLRHCRDCQQELDSLRRDLDLFAAPRLELSAAAAQRIAGRVKARIDHEGRQFNLPAWSSALAAAAALVAVVWLGQPEIAPQAFAPGGQTAEIEIFQEAELLRDLELLQNLDLLQELEGMG